MKTFDQRKDEVAKKNGYLNWEELEVAQYPLDHEYSGRWILQDNHWEQAAELYAQEVAKDAWERACEAVEREAQELGTDYIRPLYQPNQEKP